ncbi:MAG TPA: ribosomal protein S18-alanine N-acetyltransferase [bacterium]|nr:ribosomal protein S18-alanine N-acetyltransferase [bacterium]HOL48057.1 ribosomal protein S18-alanine N-acetyltransferase [bacterium]HPQ19920.1 ribosomal protein S18-alanine N-acetyltransferase [bacterium]
MENNIKISQLTINDLEQILEIEEEAFITRWSKQFYIKEITNENSYYIKAKINNIVVGFAGLNLILDEAHITKIAVRYEYRKKGIATKLLNYLIDYLKKNNFKKIYLEVRKFNLPAINFYQKNLFKIDGIRKGYYIDTNDDAILMSLEI